jgi:hypothetical protein
MEELKEREDGWEGDLIIEISIIGEGQDRRVLIKSDRGNYDEIITELKVVHASDEFSLPLFDPEKKLILIGWETELHVPNVAVQQLVQKVITIAFATKSSE